MSPSWLCDLFLFLSSFYILQRSAVRSLFHGEFSLISSLLDCNCSFSYDFRAGRRSGWWPSSGMERFSWSCQMIPNMPSKRCGVCTWAYCVSQNTSPLKSVKMTVQFSHQSNVCHIWCGLKDLLGEHVCPAQVFKVVYPRWPSPHNVIVFQAEDVRRIADSELGFQQVTLSRPTQAKTYLFINTERMVVGCLVAEPIRQVGLEMCVCVCGRFSFSQLFPTTYNKQCLLVILHHTGVMSSGCEQFNQKVKFSLWRASERSMSNN